MARWLKLGSIFLGACLLLLFVMIQVGQSITSHPFTIGLIGDLPYTPREEQQFPNLIADLNRSDVAFVVHDGDIKSGAAICDDAVLQSRLGMFQQSKHPFVFLPGDNEWTDCHRTGSDPLERLAKLRRVFFATDSSLGQTTLKLEHQSRDPSYTVYRENVRWVYQNIMFCGLHIVGSNNNLGRTPEMDREYTARNTANLAWMKESFAIAKQRHMKGVMLMMQANPWFEKPSAERTGFNDFLESLQNEVGQFKKPVVLVHGDSHYFRIDKPLVDANKKPVPLFTRTETFGTPNVHWVKATIQPNSLDVFRFEPILVNANLQPSSSSKAI
jgi:hypothetical protein